MIPHCSFGLHFSNNEWCWTSFHVFVGHLYVFFGEVSCLICHPFFWLPCLFVFYIELHELFVYFGDIYFCPLSVALFPDFLFFHSESCLFFLCMVSFAVQKLFSLIGSHLIIFVFIFSTIGDGSKKIFLCVMSNNVFLMFPLRVL